MEVNNFFQIKTQRGRGQIFLDLLDKYCQSLSASPFSIDTKEKEMEVLSDIKLIMDEEMDTGSKLYLLNFISSGVDDGKWCMF